MLTFAFGLALLTGIVFGAAPAWFATRTDPVEALRGAGAVPATIRRSRGRCCWSCRRRSRSCSSPARRCWRGASITCEGQDFGFACRGASGVAEPAARDLHGAAAHRDVSPDRGAAEPASGRRGIGAGALQSAHRQLGRADFGVGPSAAEDGRAGRRLVGPRERELPAAPRRAARARPRLLRRRQRDNRRRSRS